MEEDERWERIDYVLLGGIALFALYLIAQIIRVWV